MVDGVAEGRRRGAEGAGRRVVADKARFSTIGSSTSTLIENGKSGTSICAPARLQQLPDLPDFSDAERLAEEKKVLGFYMSSHPLARHAATLQASFRHTEFATSASCRRRPKSYLAV